METQDDPEHTAVGKQRTTRVLRNPTIMKIHGIAKDLRETLSTFFDQTDQSLIRFSFGVTPNFYQFKMKFGPTFKSIKFIVNRDPDVKTVQCVTFEKTKNIILDIDEIYRERNTTYIDTNNLRREMPGLFAWGMRKNANREKEIHKAPVLIPGPEWKDFNGSLSTDHLYCDLIVDFTFSGILTKGQGSFFNLDNPDKDKLAVSLCEFNLLSGSSIRLVVTQSQLDLIKRNKLLVFNYLGRFNVMGFTTAKHHLKFSDEHYAEIAAYLETQRGKHDTQES